MQNHAKQIVSKNIEKFVWKKDECYFNHSTLLHAGHNIFKYFLSKFWVLYLIIWYLLNHLRFSGSVSKTLFEMLCYVAPCSYLRTLMKFRNLIKFIINNLCYLSLRNSTTLLTPEQNDVILWVLMTKMAIISLHLFLAPVLI